MKRTTMQFTIDDDAVGTLVLDYEFTVSRTKDSDGQGRTWHVPRYTHGLLSAEFSAPGSSRSMKWAFKSGKEMDGRMKKAIQSLDHEVWEAIEDYVKSLVNDPNYEGDNDADPRDPAC